MMDTDQLLSITIVACVSVLLVVDPALYVFGVLPVWRWPELGFVLIVLIVIGALWGLHLAEDLA